MRIPFVKAEGAGNDFLITESASVPPSGLSRIAQAICHRQRGVGADGWYLVDRPEPESGFDAGLHLYNSDGSQAELSGNGTRCVAAWLASQQPGKSRFRVLTGAGPRELRFDGVHEGMYRMAMHMGQPEVFPLEELAIPGDDPVRVQGHRVDVGNPQFSVRVDDLDFDWKSLGAQLEAHPAFPKRSNISFFRAVDTHRLEARFFERGAGATLSSGTGATGALAAAMVQGLVSLPATVVTEGEDFRFEADEAGLTLSASARLVAEGLYYFDGGDSEEIE